MAAEINNIPYKIYLSEDEMPKAWYNVRADMKVKPAPLLNPGTGKPMGFEDLRPVFCDELIRQELDNDDREIPIPQEILDFYKMYRPSPLVRAYCLEKALGTPAKIYYKFEGNNTSGSHKLNSAIAQAYYAKQQGLTGVTTHFVSQWEQPANLDGITVTDAFTAAAEAYAELKQQQVDLTVCIYHGGFENDLRTGAPLYTTDENQGCRICNELGFDILLAGHQHMPVENLCLNGTYTCQPPDKAAAYIRMDVTVGDTITAESRLCRPSEQPLPAAEEYLAPIDKETSAWLDRPVGHLDTALTPSDPLDMALNGSLIANFFNQVQLEASGADISCASLANTVRGFDKNVTVRDIVSTYIFPNTLVTLAVNRAQLKRALERSAEYFTLVADGRISVSESFLHPIVQHFNYDYISGVNVTFDLRRPVGDRVTSILWHGEELDDTRSLSLCMNNYRASGAGGYGVYTECGVLREQPTEIAELIIDYVLRHKDITVDKTKWLNIIY